MGGTRFLLAAVVPAFALAQDSETLTPTGPATLYSDWHGGQTDEGLPPAVLTAFTVTVGPGGQAGRVRLRVHDREGTVREGAAVTLPVEPGTYTFPAPHIAYDYRDVTLGLDQETGGHAIAAQLTCEPGEGDICDDQSVDVYRPVLGDGVMPDRRLAEVQRGRKLTIDAVSEPDSDEDLVGDTTEDRTNLRTTMRVEPLGGHRLRAIVSISNAGPRTADRPRLALRAYPSLGLAQWGQSCLPTTRNSEDMSQTCLLDPLPAGTTRDVTFVLSDPGRLEIGVDVEAEGPDLAAGDEYAFEERHHVRPPVTLEVVPWPSISRRPLYLTVRSRRAGTVRLRLATGRRTWVSRDVRFARGGSRRIALHLSDAQRKRLLSTRADSTLTARSGAATFSVTVHPSY
ncbi:hypothetical protein [Solirubrobacter soli]|uniref:hypothetical protein n=1 Tax=Solirubrobacter soli TaxID=363832 RepID=UPI00040E357C|nr:hypothetical protein [Solirubrobacter soli]